MQAYRSFNNNCAQADGVAALVVSMALTNLWNSSGSRVDAPLAACEVQPEALRARVQQLLGA